jgi:hypothetical protein
MGHTRGAPLACAHANDCIHAAAAPAAWEVLGNLPGETLTADARQANKSISAHAVAGFLPRRGAAMDGGRTSKEP